MRLLLIVGLGSCALEPNPSPIESGGFAGGDSVNGAGGTDGLPGFDGQGSADGIESGDGSFDATDSASDGSDMVDVSDGADGADGVDFIDGQDSTDGTDDSDGSDATDGADATDASDGSDGTDGVLDVCAPGTSCTPLGLCCTCSGSGCEQGIDNAMSGVASLANGALADAVTAGELNLLVELAGDTGDTFTLNVYPVAPDAGCDVAVGPCPWWIDAEAFDAECTSRISFDDAVIGGDVLTAGGKEGTFLFALPIQGLILELEVALVRIEGKVDRDGDLITGISGIIAGAIAKSDIAIAVDALPDDGLPLPKEAIKNLLESVIKADVDAFDPEGNPVPDGIAESASIALLFEGVPATIAGVAPPVGEAPPPECAVPPSVESSSAPTFRLSVLQLGDSGGAGQGLDVDGICLEPPTADICGG